VQTPVLVLRSANDYTYDAYGNLKTKIEASKPSPSDWDAIQKTTTYIYQYEIDPQATAATFHKLAQEIVNSVVNPNQNKTVTNTYDNATGDLLTTTDAGLLGSGAAYSSTTNYGYTNGKLTSIDGPRTDVTDVTSYVYDPMTGYLTSTTQPIIGTTTHSNHDALGNPRTVLDQNGNSTAYTYDDSGRVLTVTAAGDSSSTQYAYVAGGCTSCGGANKIDHITLPEGNAIWYTYDTMGNLSKISDTVDNSINYTYDSEGNKLTERIKDSAGSIQKALSYQYNALSKLTRTVNPDSTYAEYGYDFRGNRTSVKDPKGNITTYSYDMLNRLISSLQPGNVGTSYTHDTNSNLTSVMDANNNTTTYIYDDKGRVYRVISPDTGTTTYQYDPAGNMVSKTDAKGVTISYQYDAANRLTKIDFPSDTDTIYGYDNCVNGKGRMCSMTDASGGRQGEGRQGDVDAYIALCLTRAFQITIIAPCHDKLG
jgi:YD repeat-containing protein